MTESTKNSIKTIILSAAFPVLLALLAFSSGCAEKKSDTRIQKVDSLMVILYDLQLKISSPEIHRLGEFLSETKEDLGLLYGPDGTLPGGSPGTLSEYTSLDEELTGCLNSCNRYHEEAYLIEMGLTEIRELIEEESDEKQMIDSLIQAESLLIEDLKRRIDSSMHLISLYVEDFYLLKPQVDSIIKNYPGLPTQPGDE